MDKANEMEKTTPTFNIAKQVPTRFCMTPRFALRSWGYCKIILDIIFLPIAAGPLIDILYIYNILQLIAVLIFALLTALIIADIVYQSKLIHGLRKNKVDLLMSYCRYTRVMWVLVLLALAVFLIVGVTDVMGPTFRRRYLDDAFVISLPTVIVFTIIQSLMMLLVVKEIKKLNGEENEASSGKSRVYIYGFTVKIEKSCSEKEKDNNKNNTESDVTCETATLAA